MTVVNYSLIPKPITDMIQKLEENGFIEVHQQWSEFLRFEKLVLWPLNNKTKCKIKLSIYRSTSTRVYYSFYVSLVYGKNRTLISGEINSNHSGSIKKMEKECKKILVIVNDILDVACFINKMFKKLPFVIFYDDESEIGFQYVSKETGYSIGLDFETNGTWVTVTQKDSYEYRRRKRLGCLIDLDPSYIKIYYETIFRRKYHYLYN